MAPKKKLTKTEEPKKEEPKKAAEADPKKRKTEEPKAEPPKKEARTVEVKKRAEDDDEEVDLGEKEKDAPADKRPVMKDAIRFDSEDLTLNVIPTFGGKVLMGLTDGGMQYLIGGARANFGVKAGRYMYEIKIIETLNPAESSTQGRGRVPTPRQMVRLGFSVAGSSFFLGDSDDSVCFDSEGFFHSLKTKVGASQRFSRDQVMCVVLNLDPTSPNANTISLFRDGDRIAEPQKLPECLVGKTLYPHINFRSVTVMTHFGPQPMRPLPFKCRTMLGAAAADVAKATPVGPNKDGKYDLVMPVSFPDEGTFDWLDAFLEKNKHYVELSDRKIIEWATKSGVWKPQGSRTPTHSNDKPDFAFQLPSLDDLSVQNIIRTVAPLVPRHYVIMEVKSNLLAAERKEILERFNSAQYKKVAYVMMGEPNDEFKKAQQEQMLSEKQEKAALEWRLKRQEKERLKQIAARQKQLEEMKKVAEERRRQIAEEQKRKMEEARAKLDEEKKKQAAEGEGAEGGAEEAKVDAEAQPQTEGASDAKMEDASENKDTAEEETKDVAMKSADAEEEKKEDEKEEEEEEETEPPIIELSDVEKQVWFRPRVVPDVSPAVLGQCFGDFSAPDKGEGFDDIKYEWQNAAKSAAFLKSWVVEKKTTSRIEDLTPSQWFKDQLAEWSKTYKEWQEKQKAWKAAKAAKTAESAEAGASQQGENTEKSGSAEDDLDIFSIENVCDVGSGEPLFSNFAFEDWTLLQLRYELYLLVNAFKKDVDDDERPGIAEVHLLFYYQKYYRKQLNPKYFNLNTNEDLVALVKDTVTFDEKRKVLTVQLEGDVASTDIFVKLAEENRRERQRRIDAGDETAKIKFSPLAAQPPQAQSSSIRPPGPQATGSWTPQGSAAGAQAPGACGGWNPQQAQALWA